MCWCRTDSAAATRRQETDADRRSSSVVDLRRGGTTCPTGQRTAGTEQHHGDRRQTEHITGRRTGGRPVPLHERAGCVRRGGIVERDGYQ